MEDYETVLLVKHEVFVYKIPPRTTNRAPRAADWNLQQPDWTGRMRLVIKGGKDCMMKLEDKTSGELFAKCPIDKYPGIAVEAVADSSRYFVIRIQDDNAGRAAFIGMGFADRGDSFDLNVALQDHFKWVEKTEEIEKEEKEEKPQLDLSLKEGQTITINMKFGKEKSSSRPKTKGTGTGFLPPPPGGGGRLPPPPGARAANSQGATTSTVSPPQQPSPVRTSDAPVSSQQPSNLDLLVDFGGLGGATADQAGSKPSSYSSELWGEFASANPQTNNVPPSAAANNSSTDWMNF